MTQVASTARSVCLNGGFTFPDDERAIVSFVQPHIVIHRHGAWLLLHSRKKPMQKRFHLWELFWGGLACGNGDIHACSPVPVGKLTEGWTDFAPKGGNLP